MQIHAAVTFLFDREEITFIDILIKGKRPTSTEKRPITGHCYSATPVRFLGSLNGPINFKLFLGLEKVVGFI